MDEKLRFITDWNRRKLRETAWLIAKITSGNVYELHLAHDLEEHIFLKADIDAYLTYMIYLESEEEEGLLTSGSDSQPVIEIKLDGTTLEIEGEEYECSIEKNPRKDNLYVITCESLNILKYLPHLSVRMQIASALEGSKIASKDFVRLWREVKMDESVFDRTVEELENKQWPTLIIPTESAMQKGKKLMPGLKRFLEHELTEKTQPKAAQALSFFVGWTPTKFSTVMQDGDKIIPTFVPQVPNQVYYFDGAKDKDGTPMYLYHEKDQEKFEIVRVEEASFGERSWRLVFIPGIHLPKGRKHLVILN